MNELRPRSTEEILTTGRKSINTHTGRTCQQPAYKVQNLSHDDLKLKPILNGEKYGIWKEKRVTTAWNKKQINHDEIHTNNQYFSTLQGYCYTTTFCVCVCVCVCV